MKTLYVFEKCYKALAKHGTYLILWNGNTTNNKRSSDRYGRAENGDIVNVRYCREGGVKSLRCKLTSVNYDGKLASATATVHNDTEQQVIKNIEMSHAGGVGELHFHNCNVTIHFGKEAK